MTSEKSIEKKLVETVKAKGGWCIKLLPFVLNGLPDRLCLMPGGVCIFVETKATKLKAEKLQNYVHRKLKKLGFTVVVLDSIEKIENIFLFY